MRTAVTLSSPEEGVQGTTKSARRQGRGQRGQDLYCGFCRKGDTVELAGSRLAGLSISVGAGVQGLVPLSGTCLGDEKGRQIM